ncbi:MAG: FAD-dependent oxidoreductase [Deltaproteobacteria bacterium]|nr:FAD-dependent oxidoreductase [Deltaproteobacteria bacterium]
MSQHVVVIGAVALGPKAACRFKRLEPDSKVTMVDQSDLISYGGCGIPYFVSGDVSDASQLQSTSFHMVRDATFFRDVKDIDVLINTGVLSIDRKNQTVRVKNVLTGREEDLSYDQLVLATGSHPKRLPIPGAGLKGVFTVSNLNEAMAIKQGLADGEVEKAVVIGAGAIGLEMAEALADLWGIETTVIEVADQILPGIVSPNMARMAQHHLEENDVAVRLEETVQALHGTDRVEKVTTDKGTIDADMVIMAVGVAPNSDLAKAAGLEVLANGAIVVNDRMQTSDPLIFAGGDCVAVANLLTGKPGFFPSGSLANREGRVIGTNLAGGNARFEGAVGTFIIKIFEMSLGSAGMSLKTAKAEGYDALSVFVSQFDRAHFYPEKGLMYMELIVERETEKVLGVQGLGDMSDAVFARVNAVAAILKYGPTTADISNLELLYAPPFSAAMDIVNALGNTAENVLRGKNKLIDVDQFAKWWQDKNGSEAVFLDCRGWGNAKSFAEKYPDDWKNIPQDELKKRMDEVPKDKPVVLICNTGVRSYEAQLNLRQRGITDTYNLQGGMATVKKWGLDI